MARELLICPAAKTSAVKHLRASVLRAVTLDEIAPYVDGDLYQTLKSVTDGTVRVWGFETANFAYFRDAVPGADVLFYTLRHGQPGFDYACHLLAKSDNGNRLSSYLWPSRGNTVYPLLLFLARPVRRFLSLKQFNAMGGMRYKRFPHPLFPAHAMRIERVRRYYFGKHAIEDPPTNYLQYWKPEQVKAEVERENNSSSPLRVIAGKQLAKAMSGEIVWIATTDEHGELSLCGRLEVDRIVTKAEVAQVLGRNPKYDSEIYAIAKTGTESFMKYRDIQDLVPSLEFEGTRKFLTVSDGGVRAQQLQRLRTLTSASSALLTWAWENDGEVPADVERNEEFQEPVATDIDDQQPPNRSVPSGRDPDVEARLQAADRRTDAHWQLVCDIKRAAKKHSLITKKTQYIDVAVYASEPPRGAVIIEVKSLENDDAAQVRRAIGQLALYRFLHYKTYGDAGLVAAFTRRPTYRGLDMVQCLEECGIGAIWRDEHGGFQGSERGRRLLPWLCDASGKTLPSVSAL